MHANKNQKLFRNIVMGFFAAMLPLAFFSVANAQTATGGLVCHNIFGPNAFASRPITTPGYHSRYMQTTLPPGPAGSFAPPYDVLDPFNRLFFTVNCTPHQLSPGFATGMTAMMQTDPRIEQYVYKKGYYNDTMGWREITFTAAPDTNSTVTGDWIKGTAVSSLPTPPSTSNTSSDKFRYVLGYMCSKVNGEWKCGCTDAACATPLWSMQSFRVSGFPTSPNIPPVLSCFEPSLGNLPGYHHVPRPVENLRAWHSNGTITVTWNKSADHDSSCATRKVVRYDIYVITDPVRDPVHGQTTPEDRANVRRKIGSVSRDGEMKFVSTAGSLSSEGHPRIEVYAISRFDTSRYSGSSNTSDNGELQSLSESLPLY